MLKRLWDLFRNPNPASLRSRLTLPFEDVFDIFAIGDIHGCYDLLIDAEKRILGMPAVTDKTRLVVLLGDYVDRGPDSRRVLEHLLTPLPPPFVRICLCGNHDDAFVRFVTEPAFERPWLDFGGDATLRSYGIDSDYLMKISPNGTAIKQTARAEVPESHLRFLKDAPVCLSVGDRLFVHAGIRPGVPLAEQSDQDMMWIREPFLSEGPDGDFTVIHGHTAEPNVVFGTRRVGIDTGAYLTGRLTVLHIRSGLVTVMND